ncbi:MAG: hypothetical protein ACREQM_15715 [Candidatus Dormibacteraceae bacterium]
MARSQRRGIGDWPTWGEQPPELWFAQIPQALALPVALPAPPPALLPPRPPRPRLATPGFVLGLIGACLCWVPVAGFGCGIFGFVLALSAARSVPRRHPGRDMATAGVVLAAIGVGLGVVSTALFTTIELSRLFSMINGD